MLLYRLLRFGARVLSVAVWRLRVHGRRNIPAARGLLVLSNHQSFLDLVLITTAFDRPFTYIARSTLRRHWLYRTLTWPFKVIHMNRDRPEPSQVRTIIDHLRQGHMLLIFPEGTRTRTGRVGPLKMGFFMMARRAGVPVLPLKLQGAFAIWPRNRLLPGPGAVRLDIGKPIDVAGISPEDLERFLSRCFWADVRR